MAETPDSIRTQISSTRSRLDRDLDRLSDQVEVKKDEVTRLAQWWGGLSAVVAGAAGILMFWPRRPRARV